MLLKLMAGTHNYSTLFKPSVIFHVHIHKSKESSVDELLIKDNNLVWQQQYLQTYRLITKGTCYKSKSMMLAFFLHSPLFTDFVFCTNTVHCLSLNLL